MSILAAKVPFDRRRVLEEAARARARGKHARALELYRRVLVVEPRNAELHVRIAPLLAATCQDLDAWASYRLAARAHLKARRPEQALALYKEATRMLPRQLDAWRATAKLEEKLGRDGEAFETLVEGRRWFTGQPYLEHAIVLLRRAHEIAPWSHDVTLDLARSLARAQQRFEALYLLDQMAERCEGRTLRHVAASRFKLTGSAADLVLWFQGFRSAPASTEADAHQLAGGHDPL